MQGTTIDFRKTADGHLITESELSCFLQYSEMRILYFDIVVLNWDIAMQLVVHIWERSVAKIYAVSC